MNKSTADPKCPNCRGTGKIELFTSTVVCECIEKDSISYNARLSALIEREYAGCTCSTSPMPPCGFCTRYADLDIECCESCGNPPPEAQKIDKGNSVATHLLGCSKCGQSVCCLCLAAISVSVGSPTKHLCSHCI